MKKTFLFSMIALLSVSLFMSCPQPVDKPEQQLIAEALAKDLGGNATASDAKVTLKADTTVSKAITVPADIELDTGTFNLTVAANQKLTVKCKVTVKGKVTVDIGGVVDISKGGKVNIETTGSLALTGAASNGALLSGEGEVTLGNASITGGASGKWQAVGASTTIIFATSAAAAASITGNGTSPFLTGVGNDSAVITLAVGHTDGNAVALTVDNVTIDISTKGAVVFPYVDTTAATLVLKGGTGAAGALKLGSDTTDNTNVNLTQGGHSVTISGTTPVIQGASANADAAAGIISGGTTASTNDATITGKTASDDVTIKAGATLAASSS